MKRKHQTAKPKAKEDFHDEEILSEDEEEAALPEEEDDFFEKETVEEKRLRIAKAALEKLGLDDETRRQGGDALKEATQQLDHDQEVSSKKVRHKVSESLQLSTPVFVKGHLAPPNCCVISPDLKTVYSGGQDCAIIKWTAVEGSSSSKPTYEKAVIFPGQRGGKEGHSDHVRHEVRGLAFTSASGEGGNLVSVGSDCRMRVWDTRKSAHEAEVQNVRAHQGACNGVVSSPDSDRLYTIGQDKALKTWLLQRGQEVGEGHDRVKYLDALFGHVGEVTAVDLLLSDRPVSSGKDASARFWKVQADSHLLFANAKTHSGSIDALCQVDSAHFVTGGQEGNLALWAATSKKPIAVREEAHEGNWISALCALKCSDIIFSGSCDGQIKVWRVGGKKKEDMLNKKDKWTIDFVQAIDIPGGGWVNSISVDRTGKLLVACVGRDHRLGRWETQRKAKNGLVFIGLQHSVPKFY